MRRSTLAIALALSCYPVASAAAEPTFRIDIPATRLDDALALLSARTGISVGTGGAAGAERSGAVRGRLTIPQALAALLAPTDYRAEQVGPRVWRLVPRPRPPLAAPARPIADIVVTARKITEPLSETPAPVRVYTPGHASDPATFGGMRDVAAAIPALTATNLGPGRDRPFIRGIADSPFNGFGQTTVSVNVDEARVTYDAPEPGLRLIDVARVEVLEGPQGPLYGTGALGGVYRIVTNKPDLDTAQARASVALGAGTAGGGQADGMLNLPLVEGVIALRLVGYAAIRAGWVQGSPGSDSRNDSLERGGRASLRIAPGGTWTVDLMAMRQAADLRDSQYVDQPGKQLRRSARLPEPSSTRFQLVSGTVSGSLGGLNLVSSTSLANQDSDETFDVTPAAAILRQPGARRYRDRRRHSVFDQEVRVTTAADASVRMTAGVSYLSATTSATGALSGARNEPLPFAFLLHRAASEAAVFADGSVSIAPRLRAGVGARLFRATTEDERKVTRRDAQVASSRLGLTPSASLSYEWGPDRIVYARIGTAFRAGGLDPTNRKTGRYDSDEVRSVDLGTRLAFLDGRLALTADAFRTRWTHVQSDYLLPSGLVATHNVGNAGVIGVEASADLRGGAWDMTAAAILQRARLEEPSPGTSLPDDRRLPVVPDVTMRVDVTRSLHLFGRPISVAAGGTYTGHSRLSFDPGLDRSMGGYLLAHAQAGLVIGGLEARLIVDNLLDSAGNSFALGNPFRVASEREYTPVTPRTVTIALSRRF